MSGGVSCVVMRGGTTRGFFFRADELPARDVERDELLLSIVAGRGGMQADGIGGADLLLSKVALVAPSRRSGVDVDVVFGAITPDSPRVKYGSNCGNLSAAVGLYAIEEGWVDRWPGRVRMFNPDSGGVVEARMLDGAPDEAHAAPAPARSGPWTGTRVELAFVDPGATLRRGLLPTGHTSESCAVDGCEVTVSVVDAGAVYAFVDARAAGVDRPADPLCGPSLDRALRVAAAVRRQVAVRIGAAPSEELADAISPNVPKVAFVAPAYRPAGSAGSANGDCVARIVSSQSLHGAYAVTGAIATAAAALIAGSVVASVVPPVAETPYTLRIGHASGVLEIRLDWRRNAAGVVIERAYTVRTARRLMTGVAHPPHKAQAPITHAPPNRASAPSSSSSRAPRRTRRAARARRSARG